MNRSERMQVGLLAALLVAGGGLVWSARLRPPMVADASPLLELPTEIAAWRALGDLPVTTDVERMLHADFNLRRIYGHPRGGRVELYLGYYGTERGGRPEHTPDACYPSAGWEILARQVIEVDRARSLRAHEFAVERNGERQLVHFWYRSYRRTGLLGSMDQVLDRLVGRLLQGRADGALVRVSTPIERGDELVEARGRLVSFAAALDPLLEAHWPREAETPPGAPS
jgi:EpsI family protein